MNVVLGCCPKRSPWPKMHQHPVPSAHHSQCLVYYHNASQKQTKEKTNYNIVMYRFYHHAVLAEQLCIMILWLCAVVVSIRLLMDPDKNIDA